MCELSLDTKQGSTSYKASEKSTVPSSNQSNQKADLVTVKMLDRWLKRDTNLIGDVYEDIIGTQDTKHLE